MFRTSICAYAWDVAAKRIDEALDRIQGEWGVRELALWMGAPAATRLLPREEGLWIESSDGGCAFAPREELYRKSRIRPISARLAKGAAPLDSLLAACRRRELDVRLLFSASCTGRLAAQHEFAAIKTIANERSSHALCLLHEDVIAFLEAVVEDLSTREGVTTIQLHDFALRDRDFAVPTPHWGVPLDARVALAAGACLCESCRRRMAEEEVDVESVERALTSIVGEWIGVQRDAAPPARIGIVMARFQRFRAEVLRQLAERIVRASACPVFIHRSGEGDESAQHAGLAQAGLAGWSVDVEGDLPSARPPDGTLLRLNARLFRPGEGENDAARLVRLATEGADARFEGICFHTLGEATPRRAEWIRQAARYSRRLDGAT